MAEPRLTPEKELEQRLQQLKQRRGALETKLTDTATGIYDTVTNPARIIKTCVHDLAADKDFRTDLLRIATNAFSGWFTQSGGQAGAGGKIFQWINKTLDFLSRGPGKDKN